MPKKQTHLFLIKSVAPECTPDSSEFSGGVLEEEVETESLR